jgi:hypothetical protein
LNPNINFGALQHNFAEHEEKLFKLKKSHEEDSWSNSQIGPNFLEAIEVKREEIDARREGKNFYST